MKTKLLLLLAVVMTAFSVNAQVSLIGVGATGSWTTDFDLEDLDADGIWTATAYTMPGGEFKFRLNHDWATAWGNSTFPNGTGDTTAGAPNILAIAGTYDITFNQATGEYSFSGGAPLPVVKLVGTAVTGGTITMSPTSPITFTLPLTTFLDGTAQFEVDGELAGGTGFPTGTFVDATQFIPVTAGSYSSVTVNIENGEYTFTVAPLFATITLTGNAIEGLDWDQDTADFGHTDADNYFLNDVSLLASGGCKFRKDHGWVVTWGNDTPEGFPGPIASNIQNISPNVAGNYDARINIVTGVYSFAFTPISIIGDAVGGWANSNDIYLTTTNGVNYTLLNQVMTAGACKFRKYGDWPGSLGNAVFPSGTATASNDNITGVLAGTYDIAFNKLTGVFSFTPSLATTGFAKSNFKVYPNPSNTNWNFTSAKDVITSIQVVDMLGKVVATSTSTTVDASALTTGVYFAKVATATATETIKVVKN
jgi:hypothetical protein